MIKNAWIEILKDIKNDPRVVVITDENGDICGEVRLKDGKFKVRFWDRSTLESDDIEETATAIASYTRIYWR